MTSTTATLTPAPALTQQDIDTIRRTLTAQAAANRNAAGPNDAARAVYVPDMGRVEMHEVDAILAAITPWLLAGDIEAAEQAALPALYPQSKNPNTRAVVLEMFAHDAAATVRWFIKLRHPEPQLLAVLDEVEETVRIAAVGTACTATIRRPILDRRVYTIRDGDELIAERTTVGTLRQAINLVSDLIRAHRPAPVTHEPCTDCSASIPVDAPVINLDHTRTCPLHPWIPQEA